MEDKEFFSIYLKALKEALENDANQNCFEVKGPDWYIENKKVREEVYNFEEKNYERYRAIFSKVSNYFDAKSHNYPNIGNSSLKEFRLILFKEIETILEHFNIDDLS